MSTTLGPASGFSAFANVGDNYSFASVVTDNGAITATNVTYTDNLPSGFTFVSATTTQGSCSANGNNLTCNLGTMPSGATANVTVTALDTATGTLSNTVNVSATEPDPNAANNSATFNVTSTYPFPVIDSFDPPSVVVKSPDTVITLKGLGFLANVTTVKFNGTSLNAPFIPNQTCGGFFNHFACRGLQVTVPASMLTTVSNPPVTVTNPSPGGGTSSKNFTITPPLVQFSSTDYSVPNQCSAATITVVGLGPNDAAATVDFETQDFIATQKRDFTYTTGTLSFAPGESTKTFDVLISKTAYLGGSADLVLSNPTGGGGMILGSPNLGSLDIAVSDLFAKGVNPIDDPATFVCQHYHDFLGRQADQGGQDYWTSQITQCGSNFVLVRESERLSAAQRWHSTCDGLFVHYCGGVSEPFQLNRNAHESGVPAKCRLLAVARAAGILPALGAKREPLPRINADERR